MPKCRYANRRSRGWVFTINNYDDIDIAQFMEISHETQYAIVGFEIAPSTGTPHMQCYVFFKNQRLGSTLENKFSKKIHYEPARGTPSENQRYCLGLDPPKKPNEDFWESGVLPQSGKITMEKLEEIMRDPSSNIHAYAAYRKIYNELKQVQRSKNHERHLWLVNNELRYQVLRRFESVCMEFCDYNYEDVVVLCKYAEMQVMDWLNGYPHTVRRGYEVIKQDPSHVIYFYDSPQDRADFLKIYRNHVDVVITNQDDMDSIYMLYKTPTSSDFERPDSTEEGVVELEILGMSDTNK